MNSSKPEGINDGIVELLMPLPLYWKIRKLIKKADELIASGDDLATISEIHREIFQLAAKYSVKEKDRNWLYAKGRKTN